MRMLDTFTSVGARQFVVTKLDVEQNLKWGKPYSAVELRDKLPAVVRTAQERKRHVLPSGEQIMAGENLIVRPSGPDVLFSSSMTWLRISWTACARRRASLLIRARAITRLVSLYRALTSQTARILCGASVRPSAMPTNLHRERLASLVLRISKSNTLLITRWCQSSTPPQGAS
jgi:hypothetical protein